MKELVIANALAKIDFDLLISDNVTSQRGCWGEVAEIKLPEGVVFIYIDENACGFIKLYGNKDGEYAKISKIVITKDNLFKEIENSVKMLK